MGNMVPQHRGFPGFLPCAPPRPPPRVTFWAPEIFAAARRRPLADIVAWERQLHTFLQGDKVRPRRESGGPATDPKPLYWSVVGIVVGDQGVH